ncbi:MAG: OmpA family protein [Pseudomonadota bacterium]
MTAPKEVPESSGPIFPRRVFVAAALSAACAGGAAGLAGLGVLSAPQSAEFQFSRGTSFASGEEARLRALLAEALADERLNVTIIGHTGDAGDPQANLALSDERAALALEIAQSMGISAAQLSAQGVGGGAPLARLEGESERAHQIRLARVTVALQLRR